MLKPQIMKLCLVFILTPKLQKWHPQLTTLLSAATVRMSQPTYSGKYMNVYPSLM